MDFRLSASCAVIAFAMWNGPAVAQAASQPDEERVLEEQVTIGTRAAIDAARAAERANDGLTSVVTADDVGQFGDQNTAEALQRLPGISIGRNEGEGRTVSVRGLPSSFTQITVNGVRIGTSEAGDSTVALDVVPADLLAGIEVSKTNLPDMDGDTVGGSVDLATLSAFGSDERILTISAEGSYADYAGAWGPEASVNYAQQFANGTIGIAGTLNYSNREVEGDDLRNEEGFLARTLNGRNFYYPGELNQRFEIGDRERLAATLNLEYRPTDTARYFLRGQLSRLEDNDIRIQQLWQTARSTNNEVTAITNAPGIGSGSFRDVRVRYQTFFQPTTDELMLVSAGGENELAGWTVGYQADFARTEWTQADGVRGRFEIDDILQDFTWTDTSALTSMRRDGTRPDPAVASNYVFNNLLFIEEDRQDDILGAQVDVSRNIDFGGFAGEVKFGGKLRQREKTADKSEFNGDPRTVGITQNYGNTETFSPPTRFNGFGPFPTVGVAQALYLQARDALLASPTFRRADNSVASDSDVTEDVLAAYGMATVNFSDQLRVIGGVRIEDYDGTSQGFYIRTDSNGRDPSNTANPAQAISLGSVDRGQTDVLPSVLVRWEPLDSTLFRFGYSRAIKRPDFDDVTNRQRVLVDGGTTLEAGNPFLENLVADQFDASLAVYPVQGMVLQASVFHKDIQDFFVDFDTNDLTQTPLVLPAGQPTTGFDRITTVINGGDAKVTGIEVAYTQTFSALPGLFSGLFVEANVTVADSESDPGNAVNLARPGKTFALPGQADLTGNLSFGWESDIGSIRFAGTHRSDTLSGISTSGLRIDPNGSSSDPNNLVFFDRYRQPYTQVDINARLNVTDSVQLYFDAININEAVDARVYRNSVDGSEFFERVQDFGATYQVGVRARF